MKVNACFRLMPNGGFGAEQPGPKGWHRWGLCRMVDGVECGGYLPGRMIAVAWWGWGANPGVSAPGVGVRAEQHVLRWHGWMGSGLVRR